MPISLYQSKKVQRYLGDSIYDRTSESTSAIDPLLVWYADVFFFKRERYIVIANPLTKLTFIVFRYTKKSHPDFLATFKDKLSIVLNAKDINPAIYFSKFETIYPYTQSDRSASAHLSRIKQEYEYMIALSWHGMEAPDDEIHYNILLADDLATFNKKGFDKTSERFHSELLLRGWVG